MGERQLGRLCAAFFDCKETGLWNCHIDCGKKFYCCCIQITPVLKALNSSLILLWKLKNLTCKDIRILVALYNPIHVNQQQNLIVTFSLSSFIQGSFASSATCHCIDEAYKIPSYMNKQKSIFNIEEKWTIQLIDRTNAYRLVSFLPFLLELFNTYGFISNLPFHLQS